LRIAISVPEGRQARLDFRDVFSREDIPLMVEVFLDDAMQLGGLADATMDKPKEQVHGVE
jgi:hypothetical protein